MGPMPEPGQNEMGQAEMLPERQLCSSLEVSQLPSVAVGCHVSCRPKPLLNNTLNQFGY
jgi:hypothetical protein